MAQNYVQILVKAVDDAKPDLDALRERLQELGREVETARVNVDDAQAAATLDRLRAKLDSLKHRTGPDINISTRGALQAEAELHAVEASMDRLNKKTAELKLKADAAGPGGLIGRLLAGIGGGGGGGAGGLASLGAGGLTSPLGIGAIAAAAAAALPELLGLASGFAAAGAGAASFYLLAHPAISNLQQDIQALSSANQALGIAQQTEQLDPTKKHAAAVQAAQLKYNAIYAQMSQDAGGAAAGVLKLHDAYVKLSNAFQPDVFRVFNAGLRLVNTLLPDVLPFAKTFADVLTTLLGQANKFAGSTGFKDWLAQFHTLEGPALQAIGKGVGEVVIQFGKLLTVMSAKDVVNAINIAFTVLSGTIDAFRHVVEAIMRAWDVTSKTMARDARQVATAFDALRHDIANIAHDLASYFDEARANVARWALDVQRDADKVVRWFQLLPGRILHALGNMGSLLVQAGKDLVMGFVHGIESMFGAIASAGWGMVQSLGGTVLKLLHIGSPSKVAHWWGQMVAQGLADGIADHARLPADAAARMAAGVAGSLGGAAGGGLGAAGQVTIQIAPAAGSGLDQMFWKWLREGVRAQGGDPRMFNRKVQFA